MVFKEVKINSMLRSDFCIRHYQTIKTSNKIYMIQEYANCFDLECLLEQRGTLRQDEARIIMRQLAKGIKDLQSLKIVHRDMKLANVLLHFPDKPKLDKLPINMKRQFLKSVNLTQIPFEVKISDFGLSTVFEGTQSQLSIVGTPLYQSPQMLMRQWYNDTVDTWALGCILYELMNGVTPFRGTTVEELQKTIKVGWYKVMAYNEPICIESCLFLLECLQMREDERMRVDDLLNAPLISEEYSGFELHSIDKASFESQQNYKYKLPDVCSSYQEQTSALRVSTEPEDPDAEENSIQLTTLRSQMRDILVKQLLQKPDLTNFDFRASPYFKKYKRVLQQINRESIISHSRESSRKYESSLRQTKSMLAKPVLAQTQSIACSEEMLFASQL